MAKRKSKYITKAYTWGFSDVMVFFETYRCLAKWAFFKTWYSKINQKTKHVCIHESFNKKQKRMHVNANIYTWKRKRNFIAYSIWFPFRTNTYIWKQGVKDTIDTWQAKGV